jgi:putative two-component system response regulator
VDDEEPIRRVLVRLLGKEGYECDVAADAAEARHKLQSQTFELMLCDVTMPGETGFSLLAYAAKAHPDTAVIMVTAIDSPDEASPAALHGAYGYIIKPFEPNSILINVATALTRRVERVVDKTRNAVLMDEISSRTEELKEALERLAAGDHALSISQEETVLRLALAAEWRDRDTGLHLKQMSTLSARLATLAGLPIDRVEQLRVASQMHDIGKIGLPDVVLLKAGPLDDDERIIVQTHSEIGFQMLQNSESPLIQLASIVARTHHERFDGTGYPCGLAGNAIPLEGRIVAIADVFDALRSERPYKHAFSLEKSLGIMRDGRGSHFDPDLLDLFVIDVEEQVNLLTSHRDEATLP